MVLLSPGLRSKLAGVPLNIVIAGGGRVEHSNLFDVSVGQYSRRGVVPLFSRHVLQCIECLTVPSWSVMGVD